ncbi:MAG: hypothetical protein ACF8SC_04560 [Phycisphaerales bacterium JB037]
MKTRTRTMNLIARVAACVALLGAVALPISSATARVPAAESRALAKDRVVLKDGTIVEGTIVRELDGYVWIKTKIGGVEQEVLYQPSEVDRIERDAPAGATNGSTPQARPETKPAADKPRRTGVPRAAVITLGEGGGKDMVGIYMTANSLKRAKELLKEEQVDVVVMLINSGGGALLEIQPLSDTIEYEFKPEFHTVAWIQSAISAAAMTAHCLEDIYFMTRGNYGACTGWFGNLTAVKDRDLEEVLYMMEKISARGKHDPKIMRSMQIMEPLSASVDDGGNVTWYQSEEGEYLVNPADRILTFNSQQAEKFGFSSGTADTIEELTPLLGYSELEWVGERVPGLPYPVSKAEKYLREFRAQAYEDQTRFNEYVDRYQTSIAMAQGMPREDRGPFVNKARQALRLMVKMVKNNPNFALFQFNMSPDQFDDWVEEQEQLLRDLMK